jgi:protein O-mannosyl-transferase
MSQRAEKRRAMRQGDPRPRARPASQAAARGPSTPWWHPALLVAATLIVYADALSNGFVWDDETLVVKNPGIKSLAGVPQLFASDLFPFPIVSHYYRPLQSVTYAIDYAVHGLAPFGYHLTSIVLHAATAVVLYRLGTLLLGAARPALVAALLFAVHPIHTEAVTYVAGRSDPLSGLFGLGALLLAAQRRRLASLVAFALALLSREASMVLVPLVVLVDATLARRRGEPRSGRALALVAAPYLGVLAAYLAVRSAVVGGGSVTTQLALVPTHLRLATLPEVVLRYLAVLLVPIDLHMERFVPAATSLAEPRVLAATAVVAALVVAAIRLRGRAWPLAFGLAWFALALVPYANVVPLATFMAEHWLYLPSVGLFLAAGWAIDGLATTQARAAVAVAVAAAAVVAYGGVTMRRNLDWRDDVSIFAATVPLAPQSARALTGLASAHHDRGETDQAIAEYERAVALTTTDHDTLAVAHGNLGNIYYARQRYDDAKRELEQAIEANPVYLPAYNALAATFVALGQAGEAQATLERALTIDPRSAFTQNNLGYFAAVAGDNETARAAFERAIELDPDFADPHNNLGSLYLRMGDLDAAEREYRRALTLDPTAADPRANLERVRQARAAGG